MNPYKFLALFCACWIGGSWVIAFAMGKILNWLATNEDD